ncbi:MAG: hypothetical protein N3B18_11135 [Desulfobacterota bacterium]|nr:hypothetical protein [Thermodesulfobacteriota bacterium]
MGIFVKTLIVVLLLFPLGALVSYIRSKRQKRAGNELLSVRTATSIDHLTIAKSFCTTVQKKWCRVRAVFTFAPSGTILPANGHPYTLRLTDDNDRVVFSEQRYLSDFLGFCWHPDRTKSTHRQARPLCDTILLEFVPPWSGTYHIFFSLKTTEPSSTIQTLNFEVREDVWPLKKKPYVHTCVDLTKQTITSGAPP